MPVVPPLKRGWLKKYSRKGLIKNWQTRYFVLNHGKLAYYQNQSDRFPYGDEFKGELALYQATVSTDRKKVGNEKQFYVVGANGEHDLLIEAESAAEVQMWVDAVKLHISYANNRDVVVDGYTRASSSLDRVGSDGNSGVDNTPSIAKDTNTRASLAGNEFLVVPNPGFVIKVLRMNGEKIFVNVCEAVEVPMMNISIGFNKWPFMILTPVRTILEDKEGSGNANEASVYDAIVNPAVIVTCNKNPDAKDATCGRVLRLLKKQYGEDLQEEYKLPKINKRYKGEIQSVLVPADIQQVSKTRSSIHVQPVNKNVSAAIKRASLLQAEGANKPANGSLDRKTTEVEEYSDYQRSVTLDVSSSSSVNNTRSASMALASDVLQRKVTEPVPQSRPSMTGMKGVKASISMNGAAFLRRKSETESSSSLPQQSSPGIATSSPASKLFLGVQDDARRRNSDIQLPRTPSEVNTSGASGGNRRPELTHSASVRRTSASVTTSAAVDCNATARLMGNDATLLNPDNNPLRLVIPYIVIRANGASARSRPEKLSMSKNLGYNTKVFVMARRFIQPEKVAWLRTTDGWITERVYAGSVYRVLQPCMHGQPLRAKIVNTRFEDVGGSNLRSSYQGRNTTVSQSGWLGFRASAIHEPFQTCFTIDVFYPDKAFTRLSRTLGEFLTMRQQLLSFPDKMIQDRAMKAGDIFVLGDGDDELVRDVHVLLETVEGVEAWLCKLLATLHVEKCKCKALVDFFTPQETDFDCMENALSIQGGINGAWPEVEQELESMESAV